MKNLILIFTLIFISCSNDNIKNFIDNNKIKEIKIFSISPYIQTPVASQEKDLIKISPKTIKDPVKIHEIISLIYNLKKCKENYKHIDVRGICIFHTYTGKNYEIKYNLLTLKDDKFSYDMPNLLAKKLFP